MNQKLLVSMRWLALLFLLCGSCEKSTVENQNNVLAIQAQAQGAHLSLVDAITLERPEAGPALGRVRSLTVLEDYIIMVDATRERVEVFDREGNYKWQIGSRGDGEGQYKLLSELAVIPNTDQILIYDGGSVTGPLLRFSIQGEFVERVRLPERRFIGRMLVTEDHNLIHTSVDRNRNGMICVTSLDTAEDIAKFKVSKEHLFFRMSRYQGLAYDEARKIIYFALSWEEKVMRIDLATQEFLTPIVTTHPKFISIKLDEVDDMQDRRKFAKLRFSKLYGLHLLSSGDILFRYLFEDSSRSTALILLSDLDTQPSAQEVKNELGYGVFTCYGMSIYKYSSSVDDQGTNGQIRVYRLSAPQKAPAG